MKPSALFLNLKTWLRLNLIRKSKCYKVTGVVNTELFLPSFRVMEFDIKLHVLILPNKTAGLRGKTGMFSSWASFCLLTAMLLSLSGLLLSKRVCSS